MALSVIIPALNEEEAIGNTVSQIIECLNAAGIDYEIIVVDDGSSDATGRIAAARGARVIRHVYNLGYGRSLKDGIREARNDAIAITDADGTYPILELPQIYRRYLEGYHMVVGQRTGPEFTESVVKAPMRKVLQIIVEYTAGRRIPDINSGFRIFSRRHSLFYLDRLCDTFSFTTGLTLSFIMNGLLVTYIPIDYFKRVGKTKVRMFGDSINTLQYVAEAAIYYNPLRIFLAVSLGLLFLCILLFVSNLYMQRAGVLYVMIALFVTCILVFALGLIAALLKQILVTSNASEQARR
jgi:polyisoprenyl-phosphate glycosyltransferase